jgi:hypothetical protein
MDAIETQWTPWTRIRDGQSAAKRSCHLAEIDRTVPLTCSFSRAGDGNRTCTISLGS